MLLTVRRAAAERVCLQWTWTVSFTFCWKHFEGGGGERTAPMTFSLQIKLFFPFHCVIDLIISAKVCRALGKYPGAIATRLTKVNEIYGGRTWTLLDFSKLWHLYLACQLWWNENIIGQIPSFPCACLCLFFVCTPLSSWFDSFKFYVMQNVLGIQPPHPPTPHPNTHTHTKEHR